jgi:hypothetical protein
MTSLFGLPLGALLLLAGVVVFVASWVFHWLLLILALVLVAVGLYVLVTGAALPL